MYAVIFTATVKQFTEDYVSAATQLRELAFREFGCVDFNATTEGNKEIAVSIWKSLADIRAWREHPFHKEVQQRSRDEWYSDYKVQVTELVREYAFP